MKTQKQILDQALGKLVSRLEKTEKFVLDQAPDLCKQMIAEEKLSALSILIPGLSLILISIALALYAYPHDLTYTTSYGSTDFTRYGFLVFLTAIGAFAGVCLSFCATFALLYLKRCPKLFLVRQFRKLLR